MQQICGETGGWPCLLGRIQSLHALFSDAPPCFKSDLPIVLGKSPNPTALLNALCLGVQNQSMEAMYFLDLALSLGVESNIAVFLPLLVQDKSILKNLVECLAKNDNISKEVKKILHTVVVSKAPKAPCPPELLNLLCGKHSSCPLAVQLLRDAALQESTAAQLLGLGDTYISLLVDGLANASSAPDCRETLINLIAQKPAAVSEGLVTLLCNAAAQNEVAAEVLAQTVRSQEFVDRLQACFAKQSKDLCTLLAAVRTSSNVNAAKHCAVALNTLVAQSSGAAVWTQPAVVCRVQEVANKVDVFKVLAVQNAGFLTMLASQSLQRTLTQFIGIDFSVYPSLYPGSQPASEAVLSTGLNFSVYVAPQQASTPTDGCYIQATLRASGTVVSIVVGTGGAGGWGAIYLNDAEIQFQDPAGGSWRTLAKLSLCENEKLTTVDVEPCTGRAWRVWKGSYFSMSVFRLLGP